MVTKVKRMVACKDNDDSSYMPLGHVMRPIHLSMQLFGVYFNRQPETRISSDGDSADHSRWKPFKRVFCRWYCVFMTLLSGLSVMRYIPAFWIGIDYVPDLTVSRIITFAWLLQCFLNRVFMLRACGLRSHIPTFYATFNDIMTNTKTCCMKMNPHCRQSRRCVFSTTVISWVSVLICAGFILVQTIANFENNFTVVLVNPFPDSFLVLKVLLISLHIVQNGAWLFPVLFQVALFGILRNQFRSLKCDVRKLIKHDKDGALHKIRDIRLKHLQLCRVLEILEQDTKYLITGNYVTNLFLICFFVYQMIVYKNLSWMTYLSYSTWLAMNVLIAVSVSISAALVNEQAHSPLECIYDISVTEATQCESVELQLFLSKLTGPPIGFTAAGLVTITKEFLLTLGSILLTYFFLLIQFHII